MSPFCEQATNNGEQHLQRLIKCIRRNKRLRRRRDVADEPRVALRQEQRVVRLRTKFGQ